MTSGDTRLALAGGASTTMTEEHSIIPIDNPEQSAWGIIGRSLGEYNRQQAGPERLVDAQRRARDAETSVTLAEDRARLARLALLVALGQFPR